MLARAEAARRPFSAMIILVGTVCAILSWLMRSRNFGGLILVLFFCSGATALVYEVIWSKFLSQMFGSTIYAQTVVLAAFMGGLALGNKFFGRWADRLQQPVRAYGYLEIAIGLYAFFFPTLDNFADRIFVGLGSGIAQHTLWLLALKGALSAMLLLGPTILMGGTLPLLAAWLQHFSSDAGRRSARFYSVNSLGAVVGAGLAGFWLVQNLGMISSLQMTALVNVTVGTTAILLSRRFQRQPPTDESKPTIEPGIILPGTLRWVGAVVALTGAVAMGMEVLASRSLAMIFGSSLQSFAVVLMAFILGIGLGSAWIASPRRREYSSERTIVLLLCVAAAWVTLLVFNIERWVDVYRIARTGLGRSSVGYFFHECLSAAISLVIFGLPAACTGAVLPLMMRAVSRQSPLLGLRVGTLLTWNTLGAVAGTLLTGFVLMPWLGLRNAFGVLTLTLALAATLFAWRCRWRIGTGAAVGLSLFAVSLLVSSNEDWRYVISSGAFRSRELEFDPTTMSLRKQRIKIIFYKDGPDATVSVEEDRNVPNPELGLRINGKPDASSRSDLVTQLLVAHLPMLARPGAKDVFIFGLGSGISAGALLSYLVDQITLAENCEPVIGAYECFTNWNRCVLEDPRVCLWREDARTVLKLNPQLYDVIIAEPSNPWTVGVGSVFSREFYELCARRLKPSGIMAQWFHVYEMHDGIVSLVLRTFNSVFPYAEIWDPGGNDIIMLGSLQPWQSNPDVFRQSFSLAGVRSDLNSIGIHSPEALLARQLASQRTAFAIPGDGPIQSDLFPVLEYVAPRAFYIGINAKMLEHFDERTRQQLLAPPAKLSILHSLSAQDVRSVFSHASSINGELMENLLGKGTGADVPCVFNTNTVPATSERGDESDVTLNQAITALNRDELDQAAKLAMLSLRQDPTNLQAAFVARIIDRERQLHPAE
jgi:predicted membrane-bound spermidine synthase